MNDLRVDAALALLEHHETTHGVTGQHDHHCVRSYSDRKEECTCGWDKARIAIERMDEEQAAEDKFTESIKPSDPHAKAAKGLT